MLCLGNARELLRVGFCLCLAGCEAQPRLLLPPVLPVWCLHGVPGAIQPLLPRLVLLLIFKQFLLQWQTSCH